MANHGFLRFTVRPTFGKSCQLFLLRWGGYQRGTSCPRLVTQLSVDFLAVDDDIRPLSCPAGRDIGLVCRKARIANDGPVNGQALGIIDGRGVGVPKLGPATAVCQLSS